MTLAQRYARWWIRNAYRNLQKAFKFGFIHDRPVTALTFWRMTLDAYNLIYPSKTAQVWGASVPVDWDKVQKN